MQPFARSASPVIPNIPFRGYHRSEAVPMTFQVALVGADGIVLGSDRQMNLTPPDEGAVTTGSQVSKIFRDDSRGVMACWSGCDPAIEVARQAVTLSDAEIQKSEKLDALANEAFQNQSKKLGWDCGDSDVILMTKSNLASVTIIKVQKKSTCWQVFDKAIAGNAANVAAYFTERFYDKNQKLPMARLIPLVAHAILEAGRVNPYGVRGLEIVCCSKTGLHSVSEDEIAKLTNLSENIEREIRARLFSSP